MAGALRREAQPFRAPTSATRPRRAGGPDAAHSTPRTRTQCLRRAAFVDGLRRDPAWAWSGLEISMSVTQLTEAQRHSGGIQERSLVIQEWAGCTVADWEERAA